MVLRKTLVAITYCFPMTYNQMYMNYFVTFAIVEKQIFHRMAMDIKILWQVIIQDLRNYVETVAL
jgi:hypothetical protein